MTVPVVHEVRLAILAGMTAFGVVLIATPLVRSLAVRFGWIARPIEDRWGRRVTARLGGVAMFAGFLSAVMAWVPMDRDIGIMMLGLSLVFLLGLMDDLRRMPPYAKLVLQLLIGCVVVFGGMRIALIEQPWLSIPLSVLWFVLVMNAFNLLDNMDGLAAGIGAIAAGFCGIHAALAGQPIFAALAASVSGASLGFLRYNFPPAKIFMGDSGSHFLGLSLALLALMGSWHRSTQLVSVLVVPTLVLAVPIFDTCFVTIQRLTHRVHPFVGGTDHVSHRLAILGLSVQQTVLALYGISFGLGLVSLVSADFKSLPLLTLGSFVFTGLVLFGLYLARVNVYRLEDDRRPASSQSPITMINTMLLHKRRLVEILVDFLLISSVYVFAHLLRFEGVISHDLQVLIVQSLPVILVIKLICFASCGVYRGVWRYLGLADILAVFKAVTVGSILSSVALLYLWRFQGYSRAVLIIDWMLSLLAVGGSRVLERGIDEWIKGIATQGIPVLIVGAGDTGARVSRLLKEENQGSRRVVVGFLDDDLRKHGEHIHGAIVLGTRERLAEILEERGIREVLIAINDPPGDLLQWVQSCCVTRDVAWKVVNIGLTYPA